MTSRSICLSCASILFGSAVLAGCGSDGSTDKSSTPFSSGVSGSQTLGSLSDADVASLCSSLGKYLLNDPALKDASCHFAGFSAALTAGLFGSATDADLQKACSGTEAKCKETPATEQQSTCSKPMGTCGATVGEFEACVTDFLADATHAFAAIPACSSITNESIKMFTSGGGGDGAPAATAPASCQTLEQKCPGAEAATGLASDSNGSSP